MKIDVLIKGGHVVDPASHVDVIKDIIINNGKIIDPANDREKMDAEQVINAEGCLVFPGLIDFHNHMFYQGSLDGIPADAALLPQGVTTAVDGGSTGIANYEMFYRSIIVNSMVRIKSYLNVSPRGLITAKLDENLDPECFDEEKIQQIFAKYKNELLGLKIRISQEIVGDFGIEPLKAAIRIAEKISRPIAVHTTNPPINTAELIELFRPGDVFSHCYHGKGSTIIGNDHKVLPAIKSARKRGVLFDACNGRNHFTFKIAQAALKDQFPPDIISSDLSLLTMYRPPVYGLPHLLSKYINMGMPLAAVISACTLIPARHMGMLGEIGTLAAGACADVAIFRLLHTPMEFSDTNGEIITGDQLLVPQLTIRGGRVVYRQVFF